jgi:hypothetical protein
MVRDGASRAAGPVVAAVLAFLGVTDPIPADVAAPPVLGGGEPVGALRARGMLARA